MSIRTVCLTCASAPALLVVSVIGPPYTPEQGSLGTLLIKKPGCDLASSTSLSVLRDKQRCFEYREMHKEGLNLRDLTGVLSH